jgi:hypothetical protein
VSIRTLAPTLLTFVPKRIANRLTVAEALPGRHWVRTIGGGVTTPAAAEYLRLWHAVSGITLNENQDRMVWRWTLDGGFTVRSAYRALHLGSHPIPGCIRVWEVWAPLRVKLFLWLAIRRRQWTADRRRRHGLDARSACYLCDQQDETIDHIVVECPFSRQLWVEVAAALGCQIQEQPAGAILDWWETWRALWLPEDAGGADSLFVLIAWELWKERNARCFRGANTHLSAVKDTIKQQAELWIFAGAKRLGRLVQRIG